VYAEDVKEDEIERNRRRLLGFGAIGFIVILALVITLVLVLLPHAEKDECDSPIGDMTVSMYCRCHETAVGYLTYHEDRSPGFHSRYQSLRDNVSDELGDPNATAGSCEVANMALIAMTILGDDPLLGGEEEDMYFGPAISQDDRRLAAQTYSLLLLYFALDGDRWYRKANWLKAIDVCTWEGIE